MTYQLHPESRKTLEQMVKLHGAQQLIDVINNIEKLILKPRNNTPFEQFVERNGGEPAFKEEIRFLAASVPSSNKNKHGD